MFKEKESIEILKLLGLINNMNEYILLIHEDNIKIKINLNWKYGWGKQNRKI